MTPTLSRLHEIIHAALPEIKTAKSPCPNCREQEMACSDCNLGYILGRPITLVDVIFCIQKKIGYETEIERLIESPPIITRKKELVNRILPFVKSLLQRWDLTKNLDENLPEVHEWLLDLLDKK